MKIWLPIIIPSLVSIIGFIVTIFTTNKQFTNRKKEQIIEKQSKLYLNCYKEIEKIITSPESIFTENYYESILLFKPEMKLIASNSTLSAYKNYLKFVYEYLEKYDTFYQQNNPASDDRNIEVIINEDTGERDELSHLTEQDFLQFESRLKDFKRKYCPNILDIQKHLSLLLRSMRKDLSNETIVNDIIE